jgi:NADH-quinone oxidoreductase subunit B
MSVSMSDAEFHGSFGDRFLREIDRDLSDRGFLVTTADELIVWVFGFAPRASPRQADVMIVACTLCNKMAPALDLPIAGDAS